MANKKTNENIYKNGLFTGVYKGANGNMLTATHMVYEVDGDEVTIEIENDFKLLYTFLYDQYRSFQSQQKDFFAEWDTVFNAICRSYNAKSKAMVRLLEDCGLLKQIKMPNSNAKIKIVADVSLKNIRFVNPKYDEWRERQKENNAERVAGFAKFNAEKEKAVKQAKSVKINTVMPVVKSECNANSERPHTEQTQVVDIKQETKIVADVEKTKWEVHKQALITRNSKFTELKSGQQSHVMIRINSCMSDNMALLQQVFDQAIAEMLYVPEEQDLNQDFDFLDSSDCVCSDDEFENYYQPPKSYQNPIHNKRDDVYSSSFGFDYEDPNIPF